MLPFDWTERCENPEAKELLALVAQAHHESACRDNSSTQVLAQVYGAGGNKFAHAVSAALLTLGGKHGPLEDAYRVVLYGKDPGGIVPGWGNSFFRNSTPPEWMPVYDFLSEYFPPVAGALRDITASIHARGKRVQPNPAGLTAATVIALDLPPIACSYLFILFRLPAWAGIVQSLPK